MENRICDLPDDLLLQILLLVPTKVAVATTVLSKRWRYVSTMLSQLEFKDDGSESLGWLIEQSLQLNTAPKLKRLTVKLGPSCCTKDIDIRKWVEKTVIGGVEVLDFKLRLTAEPTRFPKSLYTCNTLRQLTLSKEILVDVSSPARLPSLTCLNLHHVVYKDEDSLLRLLSSSPLLKFLTVKRHEDDNLKKFTVKVPSLKSLYYKTSWRNYDADRSGLLVIDSPALVKIFFSDVLEDCLLLENTPCLDEAWMSYVPNPHDKFLRFISSVRYLLLRLTKPMVEYCSAIQFSWLIDFYFRPDESVIDWLEPLILLLQNSPKLQLLTINTNEEEGPPLSWNQPTSIPGCLSSHLEMFEWIDYGGREYEKQLVTFILANSKCLKTVEISFRAATSNLEEKKKELECLPRISTSSQLLFPTRLVSRFRRPRMNKDASTIAVRLKS